MNYILMKYSHYGKSQFGKTTLAEKKGCKNHTLASCKRAQPNEQVKIGEKRNWCGLSPSPFSSIPVEIKKDIHGNTLFLCHLCQPCA
jgi:hypothetical protein